MSEADFWASAEGQRLRAKVLSHPLDLSPEELTTLALAELNGCIHSLAPHTERSDEMHASACAERARSYVLQLQRGVK